MVVQSNAPLITVLDHDPALLRLMQQVLTQAGYRTLLLPDGSDAYFKIKEQQPDLVVLDTWLGSRDSGWDVLEVLRLDEETRQIPVLVCSSDLGEFERRTLRTAENGRVEVLNKPFDVELLVAKIKLILGAKAPTPQLPPPRFDQLR